MVDIRTFTKSGYYLKHHLYYNSSIAHKHYLEILKSSREGIDTNEEVLDEIEHIIVPLIKNNKQSVNQVFINHKDILSMSKSFKTKVIDEMIYFHQDFAKIHGQITNNQKILDLEMILSKLGKKALINHNEIKKTSWLYYETYTLLCSFRKWLYF